MQYNLIVELDVPYFKYATFMVALHI